VSKKKKKSMEEMDLELYVSQLQGTEEEPMDGEEGGVEFPLLTIEEVDYIQGVMESSCDTMLAFFDFVKQLNIQEDKLPEELFGIKDKFLNLIESNHEQLKVAKNIFQERIVIPTKVLEMIEVTGNAKIH
jgi:hypothetical protein